MAKAKHIRQSVVFNNRINRRRKNPPAYWTAATTLCVREAL